MTDSLIPAAGPCNGTMHYQASARADEMREVPLHDPSAVDLVGPQDQRTAVAAQSGMTFLPRSRPVSPEPGEPRTVFKVYKPPCYETYCPDCCISRCEAIWRYIAVHFFCMSLNEISDTE